MLTHNTAVVLPVVTTLIFLVAIAAAPRFRWLRLRNLVIVNLAVLALYVFWIPALLNSAEYLAQWHPASISFRQIYVTFRTVYANQHLAQAVVLAGLWAAALWGWRRRPDWRWFAFALLGTVALPLMLLVASAVYRPVFFPRTIIWTAVPFFVACGVGLARLRHAGLRYLFLAGLLLVNLYGVAQEYSRAVDEPWDEMTGALAEAAADEAAVVLCPNYNFSPFNYYWRDDEREMAIFGRQPNMKVRRFLESAGSEVSRWWRMGERRDLAGLFDEYAELWVVDRESDYAPQCDVVALPAAFPGQGRLISERQFGRLRLLGYARHAED